MGDIEDLHSAAVNCGSRSYTDPSTGYEVFTSATLTSRGRCCGCGCRHCPYSKPKEAGVSSAVTMLHGSLSDDLSEGPADCLMWSGGKDSFLAARALTRERGPGHLVFLTTYEASSGQVAHQEVNISQIARQAATLNVPLVGVPLVGALPYAEQLRRGLEYILLARPLSRLCNGDLHLEHIRKWREDHIGPIAAKHGMTLHSPLWRVDYADLMADLLISKTPCRVCALGDPPQGRSETPKIGDLFDEALIKGLDAGYDAFGENGEFHSIAEVWDGPTHPLTAA